MMKNPIKRWLFIIPALYWAPVTFGDYKSDIGYTELENLLGTNTPTGVNVKVTQVEASTVDVDEANYPIYAPDTGQFIGKTFSFPGTPSTSASGHASGVGSLFYGNDSIAHGVSQITSYEANGWINSIASNTTSPPVNGSRIANHSWVGSGDTPSETGTILRQVDRQVQQNEFIQVVGMNNSASNFALLGSAFNVIAVGRTDGGHDADSKAVDSVYVAGRTRPDLVAPMTTTSDATPIASAAAALLVETGHNGGLTLSKGLTDISGVGTVYNAERAETVKAALMAGADRVTANTFFTANITDYRSNGHQTTNGLDDRFGAGQVNILHSYKIIAAAEQDSQEEGGGVIGLNGFDYDGSFDGTAGSITTATYKFSADTSTPTKLSASLVWNVDLDDDDDDLTTTLRDLNLELFDVTTQTTSAFSASTIDNTENIWVDLITGHSYELLVKSGETSDFSWDYALAWHISPSDVAPIPVPAAFYLFASAIAGIGFVSRRRS